MEFSVKFMCQLNFFDEFLHYVEEELDLIFGGGLCHNGDSEFGWVDGYLSGKFHTTNNDDRINLSLWLLQQQRKVCDLHLGLLEEFDI